MDEFLYWLSDIFMTLSKLCRNVGHYLQYEAISMRVRKQQKTTNTEGE